MHLWVHMQPCLVANASPSNQTVYLHIPEPRGAHGCTNPADHAAVVQQAARMAAAGGDVGKSKATQDGHQLDAIKVGAISQLPVIVVAPAGNRWQPEQCVGGYCMPRRAATRHAVLQSARALTHGAACTTGWAGPN